MIFFKSLIKRAGNLVADRTTRQGGHYISRLIQSACRAGSKKTYLRETFAEALTRHGTTAADLENIHTRVWRLAMIFSIVGLVSIACAVAAGTLAGTINAVACALLFYVHALKYTIQMHQLEQRRLGLDGYQIWKIFLPLSGEAAAPAEDQQHGKVIDFLSRHLAREDQKKSDDHSTY